MREDIQQMKESTLPPPPPPPVTVATIPIPTTVPQTPTPDPTPTNPTLNTETTTNNPDISPEKMKSLEVTQPTISFRVFNILFLILCNDNL